MSQDTISLDVSARDILGKQVRALRNQGIVPAVIHDHGKPSVHVQADSVAAYKAFKQAGKHHPVQLSVAGKKYIAMIKVAEFEPRKQQLTHLVFNAVSATQKVEAEVPIHPQYDAGNESSPAERNGLLVISNIDVVAVKALANKLPDALYYNAETLIEAGDHVTIADLVVPADVEIDADNTQTIATVFEPSAIAAANDAAGGDADDETAVPADHESTVVEGDQAAELSPGGRKEAEDHDHGVNPEKH